MSIVIDLFMIPRRILPDKWKAVYEESLQLVQAYDFMDRISVMRNGLEYCYAERTQERENFPEAGYRGWRSIGDMRTGGGTEEFELYGDIRAYLSESRKADSGGEVLLNVLKEADVAGEQTECINLWGGRTKGEDSHIYLLAIGCLFAFRFPEAVVVAGSISAGQCKRAVRWANQHLRESIGLPDTGQMRRLLGRLKRSSVPRKRLLNTFLQLTIEAKDKKLGRFLKEEFHKEEVASYYKERLTEYSSGQRGFVAVIKEYLEMGFPFEELCRLAVNDEDGPALSPEEFLTHIMEMGLFIEKKETEDVTRLARERADCEKVDSEWEEIARILAKICGAENRNVNAFYPLDKIRGDCRAVFGDRSNVDFIIDRLMEAKEKNAGRAGLQELLYDLPDSIFGHKEEGTDRMGQQNRVYDVEAYRELINFVPGCSVRPELKADLIKNFKAIHSYAEAEFDEFRALGRKERENYFIAHNRHVLLRREVWDRIFEKVMDDDYIIRIYGLFGINCASKDGYLFCKSVFASLQALDYYWEITLENQ